MKFIYDYRDEIIPLQKQEKELQKLSDFLFSKRELLNDKSDQLEITSIEIKLKKILSNLEEKRSEGFMKFLIIGDGIGAIVTFFGFLFWYRRVQKPLDEKLKAELKKAKEEINHKLDTVS
jgi:5'-3' exonuclease